jgi:hypothetical protein
MVSLAPPMKDLQAKLEKLLTEAEDCELVAKLATDSKKRELFERLARDLRRLAGDIEIIIAAGKAMGT